MPDEKGNFKGIAVPALPWREEAEALDELERDKDAQALVAKGPSDEDWPYDDDPPDPL